VSDESIVPVRGQNVVETVASVEMRPAITNTHSFDEIGEQLRSFIDPARVLTRPIDRIAFASDGSFYRLIPLAVVQPINTEEVRQIFRFCRVKKIPMTFRAGGTSLSGQAITHGILVDVGRYWRSANVEDNGRLLRVEPGLIGQ
jgi:D-lactate dehydrogenase